MSARGKAHETRWGPIGQLELSILDDLWLAGKADAKAVHVRLGRPRKITLNTIQSAMKRLHEKDLLAREKVSHAYVYAPTVERAEFQRTMVEDALEPVLDGQSDSMIAAFVDLAERAGEDTLARLEKLVAQRRRQQGGKP